MPNSVTSIGSSAFYQCYSLASIAIPNSVTSLGSWAFCQCSNLTSVTIGTNVTAIPYGAFSDCSGLAGIAIPNSVTYIGEAAFSNCTSLASITIPGSVTSIWDYAFSGCSGLTSVCFQGNAPRLGADVFDNGSGAWDPATIYYLPGTTGWGASVAGLPTALWTPQAQISDAGLGVRTNQFGFTITGTSNIVVAVEASTNLANATWSPLQTITLSGGSAYFSDPQWTNYASRFYRLSMP
jgi:hypothetical protein